MTRSPRVSIVLATHNQDHWLARTLASVQAQTWSDWELLLVDDGSTDDTSALIARHADDPRIRVFTTPHRERCVARNRGLSAARGELIAFLDGDDLWHPTKLARQVAGLDANPHAGWCYTVARFIDAHARALPIRKPPQALSGDVFGALLRANFIILASVMARRTLLAGVGGFDERLPALGCEDWDLWLRCARQAPVHAIDDELTGYRRHSGNTGGGQLLQSGLAVLDKHYSAPETSTATGLSHAAARARLLWYHAGAAVEGADPHAKRLAWRAFRESPSQAVSRPALGAMLRYALPAAVQTQVFGARALTTTWPGDGSP